MNREPQPFPPDWACAWGDDVCGLWAEFMVKDVRQRFRWIAPGEFWMGTPVEGEGGGDEYPRHRVLIRGGFWLADTACTQALWEAVMRRNPSHFELDLQCPVESVSWIDVQHFLQALGTKAFLQPDLPTEAEWEYACRAGTESAFYFGAQITPEQVNFGRNRKQTVPVKALPANAWGLFQMHGNVWEWCKDGPRLYAAEEAVVEDPEGPSAAGLVPCVLRGGSWDVGAWHGRSAYRNVGSRFHRYPNIGFRLVLRSKSPVQ